MATLIGHKIFADHAAKRRWVDLYEMLNEREQQEMGERVRKLFDQKVTSLEQLDNFYITADDVGRCFNEMKASQSI